VFHSKKKSLTSQTASGPSDAKPFNFAAGSKPAYKPYTGKFEYKENKAAKNTDTFSSSSSSVSSASGKIHQKMKPSLPKEAITPGGSIKKALAKRRASSDELVLPHCPTVIM